jgi:hypothetical protein
MMRIENKQTRKKDNTNLFGQFGGLGDVWNKKEKERKQRREEKRSSTKKEENQIAPQYLFWIQF